MRRYDAIYFIREGVRGIFLHGLMSFAAISAITACMIIIGSFFLLAANIGAIISSVESQNEMTAYIDKALSDAEAKAVGARIRMIPNVDGSRTEYISKAEALDIFARTIKGSSLLEGIELDNPLRDRYRIYVTDIKQLPATADEVRAIPGVAEVSVREDIAEFIIATRNIVNTVSFAIALILLVVSVFIISNTVRLAAFDRREEIAIMKMVGAANSFVRWPFLVEGVLLGLFAAALGFFLQWGIYDYVVKLVAGEGSLFQIISYSRFSFEIMVIFAGAGLFIGISGSVMTIRKYLRV